MTILQTVLLGRIVVLGLKVLGYSVPASWFEGERRERLLQLATISLLAGLTAVQTLADGREISVDARVPALAAAALLLTVRAPFIVVVVAAALTAAVLRRTGIMQ